MAKVNPTSSSITAQYYITKAEGLSLIKQSAASQRALNNTENENSTTTTDYCGVIDITNQLVFNLVPSTLNNSRAAAIPEHIYEIDDKENFYITDGNNNYSQKAATLLAKTDDVYVWVIDEYKNPYINKQQQKEITKETAQVYAQKMQDMYKYITNVYTDIPAKLIYSSDSSFSSQSIRPMKEISKTGTKINIVITDCNQDNSSSSVSDNIIGFTNSVDLLASDSNKVSLNNLTYYSNQGNYFYLDNYWAAERMEDSISTLAHEFQHLISFGSKWVEKNLSLFNSNDSVAYNEMMSMLCEDMMQEFLGLKDLYTPLAHLPYYNSNYSSIGLLEYNNSSKKYLTLSYAGAYAFGAWIAREFGGTNLIHQMSTNNYIGMNSIINAITEITGKTYTEKDLLLQYIQVLINENALESVPTMNKAAKEGLTFNSYTYPMKAINLWKLDEIFTAQNFKNATIPVKFDGPTYLSYNSYNSIPSKGFTLHKIGTISEETENITLTLNIVDPSSFKTGISSNTSDAEKLDYYVLIY